MKVVLCSVPINIFSQRGGEQFVMPPKIAIVSLMYWMEKYGYSGEFYDMDMLLPSDNEIFDYFKSKNPDVVGLSAVTSGSYSQVKRIASIIRRACPSVWIVVGGNMAVSANVILRKTEVDICVEGEGEKPWVDFLDYVNKHKTKKDTKELSKITGLAFLNEQDEMEFTGYGEPAPDGENRFPDYDLLSKGLLSHPEMLKNYFCEGKKLEVFRDDSRAYEPYRKPQAAVVWTSKGCVCRCTFCQRAIKGYRVYDLQALDQHLAKLKERYDTQFIYILDENFGSLKRNAYEIVKLFKKYDMLFAIVGARCTSFNLDDLKFFKDNGCTTVQIGIESGSQKMLDIMEKRFKVDNLITTLKNSYDLGFFISLNFCIGMPGETDQTIMESSKFLAKIAQICDTSPVNISTGLSYATPFPGTPLYEYCLLQGVISNSVDAEEAFLIHDKRAEKLNFVNLTGMPTKTVIFWNFLFYYEAMRVYYSNRRAGRILDKGNPFQTGLPFSTKVLRFFWRPITDLNGLMARSPLVAKMPRFLIYVPMRNLLYAEYRIQIMLRNVVRRFGSLGRKIAEQSDFQIQIAERVKKIQPIKDAETQSLRKINEKLRAISPQLQTLTERNQQILYLGR